MKKTLTIAGIIVLALAIAFIGVYFFAYSDSVTPATLVVTSGIVQLDTGLGFKPVTGTAKLSEGDIILTQDGARAAIVLYETSVTLLEPTTQIEIKELSKVASTLSQGAGVTYTQFASLTTMKSLDIQIQHATINAQSSSGASYRINMDGVRTSSGFVTLKSASGFENIADINNAVVLDLGQWNKRVLTTTEKAIMKENSVETSAVFKITRNNLVFTNKKLLGLAQKKYEVTPVMLLEMINQADSGKITAGEIADRVPINIPVMTRIIAMTDLISKATQNYYAQASASQSE